MHELLLFILLLLVLYHIIIGPSLGRLSGISLFIYSQAAMGLGTLPALDPLERADRTHAALITATFGLVVLVAGAGSLLSTSTSRHRKEALVIDYRLPIKSVVFWILASILVSVSYFVSIGYVAFFNSLAALSDGSYGDISALRLDSYAGSRYFFPGYVNQFKNALLPALTIATIISLYRFKSRWRLAVSGCLASVTLVLLLGTGQRGAFILALALVAMSAHLVAPRRLKNVMLPLTFVGISLFFITTFASGRVAPQLHQAQGIQEQFGILWDQLVFRVFGSNQASSIGGFRYIYGMTIPFGSEWVQGLIGVLPGQIGSDLSNQIFAQLYGTSRGTAPLSLWGAAYHNLGFHGAIVFAAVLAIALTCTTIRINKKQDSNLIEIVGMAGVIITLATWIADGPTSVLNNGLTIYVLLWWWGSSLQKNRGGAREVRNPADRSVQARRAHAPHVPNGFGIVGLKRD